jgi:RimJ/RimL family protein N-acetyltransferase
MTHVPENPIELERVRLRAIEEADADAIFAIQSDEEVARYQSRPALTQRAEAEELIARIRKGYDDGHALQLGIERKEDALLIGTCLLFHFDEQNRRAEIGYTLGRPHWSRGYMHEALTALVDYAFGALDLIRLEADIDPRNVASARSLERLGFTKEGYLRERWIVNGVVSDTALYGLLRREWVSGSSRNPRAAQARP